MNKPILGYFSKMEDCLSFLFDLREKLGERKYTFDYVNIGQDGQGSVWVWAITLIREKSAMERAEFREWIRECLADEKMLAQLLEGRI